ncbi:MAG: hypothetical protein DWI01_07110 [Planctomycetota bacterium]|nr:MAG: hypothetical protein DWI01_07110 [Planctomycetota bacterium]
MPAFPIVACMVLPLAANDWLEGLVPFLFFVIWIVSQVVGGVRRIGRIGGGGKVAGGDPNAGRPVGPAPGQVREVRPPVVPVGEPDRRAAQDDLQRQIEAFRRGQAAGGIPDPPRRTPSNPPALPKAPPRREPVAGKPAAARGQEGGVRRSPAPTANRSAAAPARQGTPPANNPPPILGGHGGEIGRHVDGAFAHDLAHAGIRPGSSDQSAVAPQTVPTVAHELVAMFRDPKTIRQVILLREVLDRPIDRW